MRSDMHVFINELRASYESKRSVETALHHFSAKMDARLEALDNQALLQVHGLNIETTTEIVTKQTKQLVTKLYLFF